MSDKWNDRVIERVYKKMLQQYQLRREQAVNKKWQQMVRKEKPTPSVEHDH